MSSLETEEAENMIIERTGDYNQIVIYHQTVDTWKMAVAHESAAYPYEMFLTRDGCNAMICWGPYQLVRIHIMR